MNLPNGKRVRTPKIYPAGKRSLTKKSGSPGRSMARGHYNGDPFAVPFSFQRKGVAFYDPLIFAVNRVGETKIAGNAAQPTTQRGGDHGVWGSPHQAEVRVDFIAPCLPCDWNDENAESG